jgi:thiol-disulfide isomerase/thioredoxin
MDHVSALDGTETTLEGEIGGRPAMVNFWAAWCIFCKEELPFFEKVSREHPEIAVIGVNLQEPPETTRQYWGNGGYTFPTLLDPKAELSKRFGVFTQPTTVFLNENGEIIFKKNGPLTGEELDEHVRDLIDDVQMQLVTTSPSCDSGSLACNGNSSPVPPLLSGWYQGGVRHLIPLQDILSGGPPKDGIPAIDAPKFVMVKDAIFLAENDLGLLLTIGDDRRFYPFRILNWHEIVNDTVGGTPVAITYCPLCATAVVYDRTILLRQGSEGQVRTGVSAFGVSGFLYQSNLLMYDRSTDSRQAAHVPSLWNQAAGRAVVGPLTGEKLKAVRSDVVRFSTLQEQHPNVRVLSTDTGYRRDYGRDPYEGYEQDSRTYFPVRKTDTRLHAKEVVYGIVVNEEAKAYPLTALQKNGTISDEIGGVGIEATYNAETQAVTFRSAQSGEEIVPLYGFWFSWVAQHPDTLLYE